jgi:hypothetical protein
VTVAYSVWQQLFSHGNKNNKGLMNETETILISRSSNQITNKISGSKGHRISGVHKELHSEELHDFYDCHNY